METLIALVVGAAYGASLSGLSRYSFSPRLPQQPVTGEGKVKAKRRKKKGECRTQLFGFLVADSKD